MTIFLGDIHGKYDSIINKMERMDISDCNIVQVGDFGAFNKNKTKIESLNDYLKSRNVKMFVIRGNHDDPSFFDGTVKLTNLELIPDYTILELDKYKMICIGGAISVDRCHRTEGIDYFKNETIMFKPELIEKITDINTLVTHTAPDFCYPMLNQMDAFIHQNAENDANLISDLKYERITLSKIFEMVSIKNKIENHFYGHFHKSYSETINGCSHRLLNIDEFF